MLQVGVHHGDDRGAGGQHALDAGAGETAAVDPAQTAHALVLLRDFLRQRRGAVGAVVVHDDHFPGNASQRLVHAPDQLAKIAAFIEGGNDEGKFGGQVLGFLFKLFFC